MRRICLIWVSLAVDVPLWACRGCRSGALTWHKRPTAHSGRHPRSYFLIDEVSNVIIDAKYADAVSQEEAVERLEACWN